MKLETLCCIFKKFNKHKNEQKDIHLSFCATFITVKKITDFDGNLTFLTNIGGSLQKLQWKSE